MITALSIERFKSIRDLSFACRKVNVFIGAPDTGKTNILEALSFLSRLGWGQPMDPFQIGRMCIAEAEAAKHVAVSVLDTWPCPVRSPRVGSASFFQEEAG